jgi:hypothetical protein
VPQTDQHRCTTCRTALELFASVGDAASGVELWFCRKCETRNWKRDGRPATMAEIRLILGDRLQRRPVAG